MSPAKRAQFRSELRELLGAIALNGGTVTEACDLFVLALRDAIVDSWNDSPLSVRWHLVQSLLAKLFER